MRNNVLILLLFFAFCCGCASSVRVKQMIPDTNDLVFRNTGKTLCIAPVLGGEGDGFWEGSKISSDKFQKALLESLQKSNLFTKVNLTDTAAYRLEARVMSQDQPAVGLNMTVTLKVIYQIFETSTNTKIYDEFISSKYTATFGSALMGAVRLVKANEGAVRENIKSFLNSLAQAKL